MLAQDWFTSPHANIFFCINILLIFWGYPVCLQSSCLKWEEIHKHPIRCTTCFTYRRCVCGMMVVFIVWGFFHNAPCKISRKNTVLFFFYCAPHTIWHQVLLGFVREVSPNSKAFSVKLNCFSVKWSIAFVRAEHCNHAVHQAISISFYTHQSHSEKSMSWSL